MRSDSFGCRCYRFDRRNHRDGLEALGQCLRHCTFLAVDVEFSGTGEDPAVHSADLSVRYEALRRLAGTSAIFSVGIVCFTAKCEELHRAICGLSEVTADREALQVQVPAVCAYQAHVLEFYFHCQDAFTISGDTAAFLVRHGMDFNRVFAHGIPYRRVAAAGDALHQAARAVPAPGGTTEDAASQSGFGHISVARERGLGAERTPEPKRLRRRTQRHRGCNSTAQPAAEPLHVLSVLLGSGKPVIFHNGLYDLLLMFAAFEAPLPPSVEEFRTQLATRCPGYFFDTRVLGEFVPARLRDCPAYLECVFRKYERRWFRTQRGVRIEFPELAAPGYVSKKATIYGSRAAASPAAIPRVCKRYARSGHCRLDGDCRFSHDIDQIIDADEASKTETGDGFDEAVAVEACQPNGGHAVREMDSACTLDTSPAAICETLKSQHISLDLSESLGIPVSERPTEQPSSVDAFVTSFSPDESEHLEDRSAGQKPPETYPKRSNDPVSGCRAAATAACQSSLGNSMFVAGDDNAEAARFASMPPLHADAASGDAQSATLDRAAHSAGYDAFCTGYVFASMLALPSVQLARVSSFANRIYLTGSAPQTLCLTPGSSPVASQLEPVINSGAGDS
jgi:hypothetical protein